MTVCSLDFAEPFFHVRFVESEAVHQIANRAIVVNLGDAPVAVEAQALAPLSSVILCNTLVRDVGRIVVIEGFDDHDCDAALFDACLEAYGWSRDGTFPHRVLGHALERQALGLSQHLGMDVFEPIAAAHDLARIPTLEALAERLFGA